jgi:transposase-like protein
VPIVHYARNLLGVLPFAERKELAADLRAIFTAPDSGSILDLTFPVAERWRRKGN